MQCHGGWDEELAERGVQVDGMGRAQMEGGWEWRGKRRTRCVKKTTVSRCERYNRG